MMTEKPNTPEIIEDVALDDTTGGLLPASHKVRDAAIKTSPSQTTPSAHPGGVNAALGDGSVKTS